MKNSLSIETYDSSDDSKNKFKKVLGQGLGSLIKSANTVMPSSEQAVVTNSSQMIPIDIIAPNRMQPRITFNADKLEALAESIKEQGILQPLIVSSLPNGHYELIAGERRLRASKLAGLNEVPVVVKEVNDEQLLALAILENIQREDLNSMEEARAYQELISKFDYTQEDVAKKLGKSRVAITNSLRLLKLPRLIQEDVANGRYSAGHARALVTMTNLHDQLKLREKIMKDMPTVREVERLVGSFSSNGNKRTITKKIQQVPEQYQELIDRLKVELGTKVGITHSNDKGKISIDYYSAQDLDRIYNKIIS